MLRQKGVKTRLLLTICKHQSGKKQNFRESSPIEVNSLNYVVKKLIKKEANVRNSVYCRLQSMFVPLVALSCSSFLYHYYVQILLTQISYKFVLLNKVNLCSRFPQTSTFFLLQQFCPMSLGENRCTQKIKQFITVFWPYTKLPLN